MTPRNLSYQIKRPCAASQQLVYDVLADVERWPDWMPGVRDAVWERNGSADGGSGRIRRFKMRGLTTREQILDAEPPHHQRYALLSGMPVKDYRADINIDPHPNGCMITWQATFGSRIPGLGNLIRLAARSGITKAAAALAQEAERRS